MKTESQKYYVIHGKYGFPQGETLCAEHVAPEDYLGYTSEIVSIQGNAKMICSRCEKSEQLQMTESYL